MAVHEWRRSFRAARNEAAEPEAGFVPATIVAEPEAEAPALVEPPDPGVIEIDFASGARMRVTGAVDAATLAAALRALSDARRSR